jgi:hypothetical protein
MVAKTGPPDKRIKTIYIDQNENFSEEKGTNTFTAK